MSRHPIYFTLENKSGKHKSRIELGCFAPGKDGKFDLDLAAEFVCEKLSHYANNKDFVKSMLERFVQNSWDEQQEFLHTFWGIKEEKEEEK